MLADFIILRLKKKYGKLSWVAKQLVCFGVAEFYFAEIRKAFWGNQVPIQFSFLFMQQRCKAVPHLFLIAVPVNHDGHPLPGDLPVHLLSVISPTPSLGVNLPEPT